MPLMQALLHALILSEIDVYGLGQRPCTQVEEGWRIFDPLLHSCRLSTEPFLAQQPVKFADLPARLFSATRPATFGIELCGAYSTRV